jgi:glycerol kinase
VILAIDQGTTGTTVLVVDPELAVRGRGHAELPQRFPRPGWVEHDPEEIWAGVLAAARAALADARCDAGDLQAVALTNQRETTVLWDRRSGRPVAPAIVWQDRRTAERCAALDPELLRRKTGLVPDPYFSATKLEWLLRDRDPDGLAFGTVDSWLVWRLTGGAAHVTDRTNASRTLLASLDPLDWDDELLELFGVPRTLLPRIVASDATVGETTAFGLPLPVRGLAGDQQAALFGQGCHEPGDAKATYGTGSFVLAHAGGERPDAPHGLLATAAADGYAVEGAVLAAGAAVQWLRDGLGIVGAAAETEALARSVESSDGVVFVPALAGLGSPWWDADARGLVAGIARGTTRAHLVRATLEGIAHQVADVVEAFEQPLTSLRADGGAARNGFLMQLQADLLGVPVEVAAEVETTALGAAALALGNRSGVPVGARYEPRRSRDEAAADRARWADALARARLRSDPGREGKRS